MTEPVPLRACRSTTASTGRRTAKMRVGAFSAADAKRAQAATAGADFASTIVKSDYSR